MELFRLAAKALPGIHREESRKLLPATLLSERRVVKFREQGGGESCQS